MIFREFYKRNLPHFQPENGIFFITVRLANSLSKHVIENLKNKKQEFEQILKNSKKDDKLIVIREFHKQYFNNFDNLLDKNDQNKKWLLNLDIRQIIISNLMYWNNTEYKLIVYCIMPNHIHFIIQPLRQSSGIYESLTKIMFSFKSYTANKCNNVLDRKGQFWQHESYDHYIRNIEELNFYVDYILKNPVKAGLVNNPELWKGTWVIESLQDIQMQY